MERSNGGMKSEQFLRDQGQVDEIECVVVMQSHIACANRRRDTDWLDISFLPREVTLVDVDLCQKHSCSRG